VLASAKSALRYLLAWRDERLEGFAAIVAMVFKNWHLKRLLSVIPLSSKNNCKKKSPQLLRGKQISYY